MFVFADKPTTVLPTTVPTTSGRKLTVRCAWSPWLTADKPNQDATDVGDLETIDALKTAFGVCKHMVDIQCRVAGTTVLSKDAGQSRVSCDINNGLRCYNREQATAQCYDYEVRVLCWSPLCTGKPAVFYFSSVLLFNIRGVEGRKCFYLMMLLNTFSYGCMVVDSIP